MTHTSPQQKAVELLDKFKNNCYGQSGTSEEKYHAKIAAKACVDEIIPLLKDDGEWQRFNGYASLEPHYQTYWKKVLSIIEEL